MYKEPFASDETNQQMEKRIKQKIAQVAEQVAATQTDTEFMMNLFNLCVLNRMAESHQRPGQE